MLVPSFVPSNRTPIINFIKNSNHYSREDQWYRRMPIPEFRVLFFWRYNSFLEIQRSTKVVLNSGHKKLSLGYERLLGGCQRLFLKKGFFGIQKENVSKNLKKKICQFFFDFQ